MNNARRKELGKLNEKISNILSELEDLKSDIQIVLDEEQECFDNLPEQLQEADRGQNMQTAIENLESALESADSVTESLEELDTALTEAQN